MSEYKLVSIQVGKPRQYGDPNATTPGERAWTSAIYKQPVDGPIQLRRLNLDGDGQADLDNHGGLDQAVLAYSSTHYPAWRDELELPDFSFGSFGENFIIDELDETSVCIGDTWSVGESTVQVSVPRTPCWKISYLHGIDDLTVRVERSGRTGWYLRVLEEGKVSAGLPVKLIERPCPEVSVARVTEITRSRNPNPADLKQLIGCDPLASEMKERLATRLTRVG